MSKQRSVTPTGSMDDPALDHASALIVEYTGKLLAGISQIRKVRKEHLVANRMRLEQSSANSNKSDERSHYDQMLWFEAKNDFQSRHEENVRHLRAIIPQATKLAQHASQLISHAPNQTIVRIEFGLRIAELETAIESAKSLINSDLGFQVH